MLPDRKPVGSVLVVDDAENIRDILSLVLLNAGFEIAAADTGARALEMAAAGCFDVLVVDLGLPDMDGMDLVKRLRKAGIRSRIVVLSGRADALSPEAFEGLGVDGVLPKPLELQTFLGEMRRLAAAGLEPAQEEVRP